MVELWCLGGTLQQSGEAKPLQHRGLCLRTRAVDLLDSPGPNGNPERSSPRRQGQDRHDGIDHGLRRWSRPVGEEREKVWDHLVELRGDWPIAGAPVGLGG